MTSSKFSVVVIGGGPAGLSAAIAASTDGASVLLVDSDIRLGGILKQCIHDGFGVHRFDENLTGPEYAYKDIKMLEQTNTYVLLQTTVTRVVKYDNSFLLTLCNRFGLVRIEAKTIVIATGCREKTSKHFAIHGSRPAGVMTAGIAQYFINILGQLPAKRAVISGSENIGMIVARRLTLEGAAVLGVYEQAGIPQGSLGNVVKCLNDFSIPLHTEHTVTRVSGGNRLKSAEIYRVDKNTNLIRGTENRIQCDTLILSVGLIPDNDIPYSLGVPLSEETGGPVCDHNYMTMVDGVFCCGNSTHINSLVDHISESGEKAGLSAARYMARDRRLVEIRTSKDFLYAVPNYFDIDMLHGDVFLYFRPREIAENMIVKVYIDNHEVSSQEYHTLRPPETERILIDLNANFSASLTTESRVELRMEKGKDTRKEEK